MPSITSLDSKMLCLKLTVLLTLATFHQENKMEKLDKKLMTKAEKNSTFSFVHTTITSRQEKKGPEITFPMLSFLYVFIKHGNTI